MCLGMVLEVNNVFGELWHEEVLGADDHVRRQSARDQVIGAEEWLAARGTTGR